MGLVVVTGASGFVGTSLCRALLAEGREVRGVDLVAPPAEAGLDGIEHVTADVRDAAAVRRALAGADVVFHLAGRESTSGDPDGSVWATNVDGTRNVIDAALAEGVRRLIHTSSLHAFDLDQHRRANPPRRVGKPLRKRTVPGARLDETAAPATREELPAYDRSKAAGDYAVREGIAKGLDAVLVHPTTVIGPLDIAPTWLGALLADIARRKPLPLVTGVLDWVDVRDVAEGLLAAERAGRRGERYLLSGTSVPLRRLARFVAHANGVQPPTFVVPRQAAGLGIPLLSGLLRDGHGQSFTPEVLRSLALGTRVSREKAAGQLGYRPRPLEQTAADIVEWLVASGRVKRRGAPLQGRPGD